jgi:hypothetical protein
LPHLPSNVNKNIILQLCLKILTAMEQLRTGWRLNTTEDKEEHIGKNTTKDGQSPWAPRVIADQLDHGLELLVMKWEDALFERAPAVMLKGRRGWMISFLATFLTLHILEMDAQRLGLWHIQFRRKIKKAVSLACT